MGCCCIHEIKIENKFYTYKKYAEKTEQKIKFANNVNICYAYTHQFIEMLR